jgi:ribosome-associated protein
LGKSVPLGGVVVELESVVESIVELLLEMLAEEVVDLDLIGLSSFTDHFIIATAETTRQARSLVGDLEAKARLMGWPVRGVEGAEDGRWILFDLNEVVVHIFTPKMRQFYDLESFWVGARKKVYL